MQEPHEELTEKQLAENFEKIQREVAEQIREYEKAYPDLAHTPYTGDEVVRQPIFTYGIHAAS